MATITISENLIKEKDLVVIPRRKYEELLRSAEIRKKRGYTQFDKNLDEAISGYKRGEFFGPFNTPEEGIGFLKKRKLSKMKK